MLLLFTVALLYPLLSGRSLYWGDILLYFDPMYRFGQSRLLHGMLPLWNPGLLCGQPYIGNPQMNVFYPFSLMLAFMSADRYIAVSCAIHIFLCGWFCYRYLCRWTLMRDAALLGAITFMGSSAVVGRLQFPPMIFSAAYLPLLLHCLDRCIDASERLQRLRAWRNLSVTTGLLLLAGHPQMAYLILATGAVYLIARVLNLAALLPTRSQRRDRMRTMLLMSGSALAVGVLIAAIQLLPILQLIFESPREKLTVAQANRFVFKPIYLLTLIFPRWFGHPASADYWGAGNAWEPALFIGWIPLIFASYAAFKIKRLQVRFWTMLMLVTLWLSFGAYGGLYLVAFYVIPGLSNFHDPARFAFLTTFALAALTAGGADRFLRSVRYGSSRNTMIVLILTAFPLLWYGHDWNPTTDPANLAYLPPVLKASVMAGKIETGTAGGASTGRWYHPEYEVVWSRYITEGYRDYGESDISSLHELKQTLIPNIGLPEGVLSVSGYEPVFVGSAAAIEGVARFAFKRAEPNEPRLIGLLGGSRIILPAGFRAEDPRYIDTGTVKHVPLHIVQNCEALPDAWIVRHVRTVEGKVRVESALAAPDFDPARVAIVNSSALTNNNMESEIAGLESFQNAASVSATPLNNTPAATYGETGQSAEKNPAGDPAHEKLIEICHEAQRDTADDDDICFDADAEEQPGLLVYSATAYPGWHAFVDSRSARLYRTDGTLLGVVLSPGKHMVRFRYQPDTFRIGMYLSLLACGALTGISCILTVGARRQHRNRDMNHAGTTPEPVEL